MATRAWQSSTRSLFAPLTVGLAAVSTNVPSAQPVAASRGMFPVVVVGGCVWVCAGLWRNTAVRATAVRAVARAATVFLAIRQNMRGGGSLTLFQGSHAWRACWCGFALSCLSGWRYIGSYSSRLVVALRDCGVQRQMRDADFCESFNGSRYSCVSVNRHAAAKCVFVCCSRVV